jgi:hypothetical protein
VRIPENLEFVVYDHTEIMYWSRNSGPLFSISPKCCARSKKTDHGVSDHNVKKLLIPEVLETVFSDQKEGKREFQKIWNLFFMGIQKFCCGPEILDHFLRSHRNAVRVPKN